MIGTGISRRIEKTAIAPWEHHRLRRERDAVAVRIAEAIRSAARSELSDEERGVIEPIEALRREMAASTDALTRTDYGAGDGQAHRSAEVMTTGIEVADTLGDVSRRASKSPSWCLVLFKLVRALRPGSCIEMGTAVGVSAAYQAAALRLNGEGRLSTLDGAASLAAVARENLRRLGLSNTEVVVGRFGDTLAPVLAQQRPVDYVFVDGHHDEQATRAYFETIVPFLAPDAVVIFDDIAWSDGMKRAWRAIATDRRVRLAVDLGDVGLCVVGTSGAGPRRFRIRL